LCEWTAALGKNLDVVSPWQLVNSLLTNWRVSPSELKKAQAILQAGG
jgi:hypothetical protein